MKCLKVGCAENTFSGVDCDCVFSSLFICNNNTVFFVLSFIFCKIALGLPFYSLKMWNKLLVYSQCDLNEVFGVPNTLSCSYTGTEVRR